MAKYTTNYNLEKQENSDYISIDGINGNFDIIDTQVKDAKDKADQAFLSASNGKAAIKAAITGVDPEVTIPTDASFQQLAEAIKQIETGVDTEDATATAGQILGGQTAYVKGAKVTGAMPNRGEVNQSLGINGTYTIPEGYHNGNGSITQSITTKSAQTFTPSTTNQTIASGQYLTGTQTILGDADLVVGNIKKGVDIFGKVGTYEGASDITGALKATVKYAQTIAKGALVTTRRFFGYDTPIKLSNPPTLPPGTSCAVAFSPDGTYMAIGHENSPYISVYKRSGDTFTKLSNLPSVMSYTTTSIAFSPDGTYLAYLISGNVQISVYKRDGDTFTRLTDIPVNLLPGSATSKLAWSPDSVNLAVTCVNSPYFYVYKRSGDTFSLIPTTHTLPTSSCRGVVFSNNGSYLAVSTSAGTGVLVYKRSGDTFTQISSPTSGYNGIGIAFSPDDTYLAIAFESSPYIAILKRSGDTFTKLSNPAVLPTGYASGIAFSPDGVYLAITHYSNPYISVYKRSGDTFTKLSNPAVLPTGNCTGVAYNPVNSYFAVSHYTSPYISIYKGDILGDYSFNYTTFEDFYYPNYIYFGYAQVAGSASETEREIVTIPIK